MTKEERKKEKRKKELEFVKSLFGKRLTSVLKNKFRSTYIWKDFRNEIKKKRKVDALTGRKLTKTWNLHHIRTDSKLYTDLDEKFYLAMNSQQHTVWHVIYEETRKNPQYIRILEESIMEALKLNNYESFIHKKKQ